VTAALIVLASAIAFVLCGTGRITMRKSALTTVSGNLTYPVYLIHQFAGYAFYGILIERTGSPVISLICTIVVAVVTGALIHYLVERPLGPVLRRIVSGPRTIASRLPVP
jgi:peptidoglycan/LPS O-acetylase OafA/YrhL